MREIKVQNFYYLIEQSDLDIDELRNLSVKLSLLIVDEKIRLDKLEDDRNRIDEMRSDAEEEREVYYDDIGNDIS